MGKSKKRTRSTSPCPSQEAQVSSSTSAFGEHSHKKKRKKHSSELRQKMIDLFGEDSSMSSDSSVKKKKRSKKHKKEKRHKKSKDDERGKKSKSHGEPSKEDHAKAGPSNIQEDRLMADRAKAMADRAKAMTPMTKEEWEKRQSVVRKVYDEETGRSRLIKGDGEVVEEIVSRERHREINRMATKKDGEHFQSALAEKVKKK